MRVFVSTRQIGNQCKHRLLLIHTPIGFQVHLHLDDFYSKYLYTAKYRLHRGTSGWTTDKVPLEFTCKLQINKKENCSCEGINEVTQASDGGEAEGYSEQVLSPGPSETVTWELR